MHDAVARMVRLFRARTGRTRAGRPGKARGEPRAGRCRADTPAWRAGQKRDRALCHRDGARNTPALAEPARRRGAWLGDDITAMTLITSLIDQAERFLPEMVTNARLNGHTWDEIARAIGTSPEEAHLRFDPESPVADPRWPRPAALPGNPR